MKKMLLVSMLSVLAVPFAGALPAPTIEQLQAYKAGNIPQNSNIIAPAPVNGTKWWSLKLVGSAHAAIMKASLMFINKAELPDIARAQSILATATNDESGHQPDQRVNNGGKTDELWFGKTPFSNGGVLSNYEHFKFPEAYARLGTICHLTQDMAVPTHAANIRHSTSDPFESDNGDDKNVQIKVSRDRSEMEPYAYYQELQDETRSHLATWVNPKTKEPYWIPAKDAPPMGQDATFGSWGKYGADYVELEQNYNSGDNSNNSRRVTLSPEIRIRQLAMAGEYTVAVLKSASSKLPPLVSSLSVTPDGGSRTLKMTVLDNRSRSVSYKVLVSREGAQPETLVTGEAQLRDPAAKELMLSGEVTATLDVSTLAPGTYKVDVRLTDSDGNTTPDEVNSDDITGNDTQVQILIP